MVSRVAGAQGVTTHHQSAAPGRTHQGWLKDGERAAAGDDGPLSKWRDDTAFALSMASWLRLSGSGRSSVCGRG